PTYAFLDLILSSEEHSQPVDGFKEKVLERAEVFSAESSDGKRLSDKKNYGLYKRILANAWGSDGYIDRSEAMLLEALRNELDIWTSEHLLIEHHPDIRPMWESTTAFEAVRNHLLATGIVLVHEDAFVIADEVSTQVRRAWGIELGTPAYSRLLVQFTNMQLKDMLEQTNLQVSGSKEDRVLRVLEGLVPPSTALETLNISDLKDLCRKLDLPVSMAKADLIEAIIGYFDSGADLVQAHQLVEEPPPPPEPEDRLLEPAAYAMLLSHLNMDQLCDILTDSNLAKSGSKPNRIQRILDSPYCEKTSLGKLRGTDLKGLCSRIGVHISGINEERIERILAWAARWRTDTQAAPSPVPVPESSVEPATPVPVEPVPEANVKPSPLAAVAGSAVAASPPSGLRDIKVDFPELDEDEQVVLALIKEARSLTETDIDRAAERHGLGWFLTKAHMADLLAKLNKNGATPIGIRSTGGVNIYEWTGRLAGQEQQLRRELARDTIDALRQGVVPECNLNLLAVGQETARNHLLELLDHVQTSRSQFKFIRGAYGSGKTFLCSWLREQAFEKDFAVATVCIGPDQPLSDLPVFFSGMINGLRTPEKRDASALADILESWLITPHKKTARIEGLAPFAASTRARLAALVQARIGDELETISVLDPGFGPALQGFYRARLEGDDEKARIALAWLRGSRSLSAQALGTIGVRGQLEGDQVFPRMRALLQVIAGGHLRGLLLIVDELELVRRFPHARQREAAYETLRLLIDESGENSLPGCLLVCTGTDSFFDDNRYGMQSYEALANRVSVPQSVDGHVSVRQPVVMLEGLDREWLLAVALRVRHTHGNAYGWSAAERLPDAMLERLVDHWTSFGDDNIDRLPRPILRELVHVLDVCEENPEVKADDFFRMPEARPDLAESVVNLLGV
ncbi:MAG: BREX system ATP-binding domain-containing protein, partial [bacterium]